MRHDEFLASVRERGEYADQKEAAQVATAVLQVLLDRITPGEAEDLMAQLPAPFKEELTVDSGRRTESYGVEEFCRRIAERTGARPHTAQWDAGAVLTTLADAISPGELNQLISQLPSGYAALFGKNDLSD